MAGAAVKFSSLRAAAVGTAGLARCCCDSAAHHGRPSRATGEQQTETDVRRGPPESHSFTARQSHSLAATKRRTIAVELESGDLRRRTENGARRRSGVDKRTHVDCPWYVVVLGAPAAGSLKF